MGLLRFIFGVMSSSKTANLLAQIHDLREKNEKVLLLKPSIDTRSESGKVSSRIPNMEQVADHVITPRCNIKKILQGTEAKYLFVDEAQFLTIAQVEELREISLKLNIDVFCYGLRVDSRTDMFLSSKRLFEISDKCIELFKLCQRCNNEARFHLRFNNGKLVKGGPAIEIESGIVTYESVCYRCFDEAYNN